MSRTTLPSRRGIGWFIDEIEAHGRFLQLECFCNENKLFESTNTRLTISEDIPISEIDQVLGSIDRSGNRLPYTCEMYPSFDSQKSGKMGLLGVKYDNIDKIFENVPPFDKWFLSWLDERMITLDTGIIINHYLSEVILKRVDHHQFGIMIPRIVLLEIERRGNRNKSMKRLSLSAFNEIRELRIEGSAVTFPNPLDVDILANFSKIAGSQGVDGFIRREIWDELHRTGIPTRREEFVLLTRDMMMACTASAEDIDTLYFCPAEPEKKEFNVDAYILAKIIIETAVTFGTIRLEGLYKKSSVICEGMWSGKDIMDWNKERLRVRTCAT